MSWTADTVRAGFTTGQPFRALAANVGAANAAAQEADPQSLLNFYRSVIALRQSLPSLQRGDYLGLGVTSTALGFQRTLGAERTVVVINFASTGGAVPLTGLAPGARLVRRWPASASNLLVQSAGSLAVNLDAQSFAVFTVEAP
jgi:glycosidase